MSGTGPTSAAAAAASPSGRRFAPPGRTEAFSDGVLAIAITLLVLDLHAATGRGQVGRDLLHQWPSYLAYVGSFLYIGVVWVNHHALFLRIAQVDTPLLWCNLGLLLATSVLPFPTAQLAEAMGEGTRADQESALVLYAVVAAGIAAAWLVTFARLHRHPELVHDDVPAGFFHDERVRALWGILAPIVPVLVGLAMPRLALGVVALTPAFYALTAEGLPTVRSRRRVARTDRT